MHYLFADYVLDTQRQELRRNGAPVKLRRQVFRVLVYLLAHREQVVLKQDLLEHLWPDQFVGDDALKSCIKVLRQALGEQGRTPRFLRTVHGQGYRFVGPVEEREHVLLDNVPLAVPAPAGTPPPLAAHGGEGEVLREVPALLASALEGEYKQVTVLCGALAEAPTLAMQLGPEAMYHLMREVLALAQDTVQRYEGTLVQVSGDSFVALFGAPIAQEDHARRAVLAALQLQQRLQLPQVLRGRPGGVAICLGLHTGPVVVGVLESEPGRPYIAASATLQLASHIQQQAAPATILVSAATYALVQDEVQGEACKPFPSDALSTRMPVYAIRGLLRRRGGVPRLGARPLSRFIGRTQELALLHARLAHAAEGQGQVLGIAGEPGLGKSRLLAEFARRLRGQPITYCEGHCLAYGRATPYLPVRDLLRQLWEIPEAVPATAVAATVYERLCEAGVASEEEALVLHQVLDVSVDLAPSAALDPQERKARTFALLRHIIRHASQRQPLLLAVENLHWIDPTSEAWLASLVERLGDLAVLLVVTYRPGYQPPWLGHSAATQMALPRLSARDSRVVLQSVPRAAQLPGPVQEAIVAKAAGNPFFVEELTWAAVAHGDHASSLPVPDTIEAVLAARLDRLPPEAKRLVQTAAVIGPVVPVPLLQRLTELPEDALQRGLAHLQAAEFLYETRLVPEQEYTFKHALTHEVAYGGLLQEQRRGLHARVVEVLEGLVPERAAEPVERLAHHALRGEVWDKAVTYGQQAGARADDRAALPEAATFFDQALQALAHLLESSDTRALAIDLRLTLASTLTQLGEYGRGLALRGEAEALARALDDRARLGRVLAAMANTFRMTGDPNGAIAAGQQALALAAALGDRALQAEVSLRLGQAYHAIGVFGRAAELLRRNVEAADREAGTPTTRVRLMSQAMLAETLGALGAFAEGRRHGEEALRLAPEGRRNTPILAHMCLGRLYLAQGDLEAAIRVLETGLALGRAAGDRTQSRLTAAALGYASALQGRLAEGRALLEEALSESIRTGGLLGQASRAVWLSEVCRLAGCEEEAWQQARQALDLARQQKARGNEALALCQLGVVHAHVDPPDVASAEAFYQQALALAETLGMRPLQAHCHLGLGTLYAKIGQREQARAELSPRSSYSGRWR
jgi:predicted ATPase/DNA-binding winged helix-turn-helix (wHTH) protein/class 3 adenylate cyclase